MSDTKHYNVIIVGAGLSGIGAAYYIQEQCPDHSFTILEGRSSIGGTWDLFQYPGIRSDSDMYTLGYSFSPWKNPQAIADGPAILQYIKETAAKFGIDEKIQFNRQVQAASWSSEDKKWSIDCLDKQSGSSHSFGCDFLFICSGYYDYDQGYTPDFPGVSDFEGTFIHPQKWPEDLDYKDKNIIVVGSGATAVTLVPELAKQAKSVTMLQRTPTYILNVPRKDVIANFLKKVLPKSWAHNLARWKNILFSLFFYQAAQRWPQTIKKLLQKGIKKELGDDYSMQHFDPPYRPWDQRLCLVPEADLFKAIKSKGAQIVTDHIDTFTSQGIQLQSGQLLDADIIISATGLNIKILGGMKFTIDGQQIDPSSLHVYRGVMLSDIPNMGIAIGYTNASWTLKCDLNCMYISRLLNHMKQNNYDYCIPHFSGGKSEPLLDLSAGYVLRAMDQLPKQGEKSPWKVYQHYIKDYFSLKYSSLTDEALKYY